MRYGPLLEIIKYIDRQWVEWLFLFISALLGWGYRRLSKRQAVESVKNKALHDGMQALLRDRIIGVYNHYQDKRFCPIYAKENVKRMYDAYHDLGGNDVATRLKDNLLSMPEEPEEREG
ncbi:hypothetical protein H171_4162 [[Clostridium] celerecrescens 18A]|uniref:Uncharacterized protein n=1 Tax=[Clostridium] celerecrescens 18A TaxID=1286362 RepID=A0A2M8ZAT7_9FIRM|nr:hypothetical protein H171_4162 [[Clostridium] celerecrescens 18A]